MARCLCVGRVLPPLLRPPIALGAVFCDDVLPLVDQLSVWGTALAAKMPAIVAAGDSTFWIDVPNTSLLVFSRGFDRDLRANRSALRIHIIVRLVLPV